MAIVILIHALIFLAFWLTNLPYQESLNNFLIGATGRRVNFLLVFMAFSGLAALWSTARMALRRDARRAGPAWLYLAIGVFFLVFFYGSFAVLFVKNPVQLYRLGQMFQYFRLIVDACLLLFLAWGLRRWVKVDGAVKSVVIPASLLVLWLTPLFWTFNGGQIWHMASETPAKRSGKDEGMDMVGGELGTPVGGMPIGQRGAQQWQHAFGQAGVP